MKTRTSLAAGCGLAALIGACQISPELAAVAGPQRPSVSSDTTTTAHGTLEVELGATWDPDGPFSTPLGIKYGSGPLTEVFLGLNPLKRVDFGSDEETGFGNTVVGLRHRFAEETESRPSLAVQSAVKLPTADKDKGLGNGELDAGVAAIATRTLGTGTLTGYYEFDVLGDPSGGTDIGHVLAVAAGHPVHGRLAAAVELAGLHVPQQDTEVYLATLNLTYAIKPSFVLDVGLVAGLNDEAPDAVLLVGLTRNLGPLTGR